MFTCYPDKETFREKARQGNLVPVYREIVADQDTPLSAYYRMRTALHQEEAQPYSFLFESVEGGENVARYSFLGARPREIIRSFGRRVEIEKMGGDTHVIEDCEPLAVLMQFMTQYNPVPDPNLPRFFGGAVGYLGYDAVSQFEKVPLSEAPGLGFPDMVYLITDTLIIFDRVKHTIKLVANAFIEDGNADAAYDDAVERIKTVSGYFETRLPRHIVDVQVETPDLPLQSNTTHEEFVEMVERAKEYIRAGDIIQVVLSQRFEVEGHDDPLDVYRALRSINPSPYMFCLELGPHRLVGSSPEIHVRCEDDEVNIRPIAGTRPRSSHPAEDQALAEELLADPKERAEHVMLVDLARNDIGRVCNWGSVQVNEFMIIERYSHVMHIVSNVSGNLGPEQDVYDLMRATFPAGTLSGAPKVRAMQIIAELEKAKRGSYGGAVGYFSFDGNLDCCITIRTVVMDGKKCYVQAGAGIVADSDPDREYEETLNKARGMLKAIAISRQYQEMRQIGVSL